MSSSTQLCGNVETGTCMGLAHNAIGVKGVVCDGCRMTPPRIRRQSKPIAQRIIHLQPATFSSPTSPSFVPLANDSTQGVPECHV